MAVRDERLPGAPDDPPGLTLIEIDHDARYVLGFPVHVAITVCADHPGTCMTRLPLPSWAGSAGAIGVRLVEPGTGATVVKTEPRPVVLPEVGTSTFALPVGACRRMLIDVSSYLPADLAPGRYELSIVYIAPPDRIESAAMPIELAAPSEEERSALEQRRPELEVAGSWGRWTNLPVRPGEQVTPPSGPRDPLRFNRAMRYLMYGPKELSEVDPAVIDVLRGVHAPESHALRAELYAARGDRARFDEQAAIIRASYPGLAWWIDRITEGRSEIAFVRAGRAGRTGGGSGPGDATPHP